MANGSPKATRHQLRPGTSVRSTSQAAATPTTTVVAVTNTARPTERASSSSVRDRHSVVRTPSQPRSVARMPR